MIVCLEFLILSDSQFTFSRRKYVIRRRSPAQHSSLLRERFHSLYKIKSFTQSYDEFQYVICRRTIHSFIYSFNPKHGNNRYNPGNWISKLKNERITHLSIILD